MQPLAERRRGRARATLIEAFNRVFLTRRASRLRVSEVVEQASVARSTFYDHFAGIDDLHMKALARPLAVLADAIAGKSDAVALQRLLDHFWENRDRARITFGGETRGKVERLLAGMVMDRLAQPAAASGIPLRLAAVQLAGAQLNLIRAWLACEARCDSEILARAICRTSESLLAGLFANGARIR